MFINFSNIAILIVKHFSYRCIISLISKNEAINLVQNADLTKKKTEYQKTQKIYLHI